MPTEFTFGAGDERISVRIESSKRSLNENQNHLDRIDSTLSVNLGAFSGSFKAEFAFQDLALLYERLINIVGSLSQTVRFKNKEEDVSLTIEGDGPGGATITGTIQPHRLKQASLIFRIDIPQSSLIRTAKELEDVIREFPTQSTRIGHFQSGV